MKKCLLTFTLLSIFLHPVFSQEVWIQIHPYPTSLNLYDTFFIDEQEGYAVGENGLILYTNDSGTTWIRQFEDSNRQFNSVFFISENEGWAAGWGDIYHTIDGGQEWTRQPRPQMLGDLQDIFFINQDTGWIAGNYELILKTTDGGDNWVKLMNSVASEIDFHSIQFTDALHGCVVGGPSYNSDKAVTMVTEDGGNTWTDSSPVHGYKLNSVYFMNQDTGFACGYGEDILKTTNGGYNWIIQHEDPFGATLNTICFFNELNGIAISGNHNFITQDGGNTWTFIYQGMEGSTVLLGSNAFNDSSGFAVGAHGRIVKTIDRGNDWERIDNSTSHPYYGIGFFDKLNGIATLEPTSQNIIMMTNDGGYSWYEKQIDAGSNFYDMSLPSENVGYLLANYNDKIVKTTNKGIDWINMELPVLTDGYYNTIQFVDEEIGFVCGTYGQVFKTSDGGLNWTNISVPNQPFLKGMSFIDEHSGWLINHYGQVIKTINGGDTYSIYDLTENGNTYSPNSICCVNQNTGYISTNEGPVFKTINGGDSWEIIYEFTDGNYSNVIFIDENRGFYKSHYRIYYTENGGESWEEQVNIFYAVMFEVFFLDDETGWYCGSNSIVGEYVSPVSVKEKMEDQKLLKVFPNPSKNQINVSLVGVDFEIIQLKVFDLNGREVQVLPQNNSKESVQVDISRLSPGLYILKVQAGTKNHFSRFIKY